MSAPPSRLAAIQAVMVRLTVDPDFGTRLYTGDADARVVDLQAGPYRLTDADLRLFQAVDARAWTTDRYRRTRLVQALIQEYAVTTAMLGVPVLDAFFRTDAFARVLGHHGSMAEAFGAWAATRTTGSAQAVVHFETAVCQARRGHRPAGSGLVTAPGTEGLSTPEGTLAAWQAGLAALGGDPVSAAAQGLRWQAPALARSLEHLLIERTDTGGLGVHHLSAGVVGLLRYCRQPRSRAAVTREARRLRVPRKAVGKTLREMVHDGLLIERTP